MKEILYDPGGAPHSCKGGGGQGVAEPPPFLSLSSVTNDTGPRGSQSFPL